MACYDKAEQKNVQTNLMDYIDIQIINPQLQRSIFLGCNWKSVGSGTYACFELTCASFSTIQIAC